MVSKKGMAVIESLRVAFLNVSGRVKNLIDTPSLINLSFGFRQQTQYSLDNVMQG